MLKWSHPYRKRLRTIGHLGRALVNHRLYPTCPAPLTFWWYHDANFGDRLTPLLLPYYGIYPVLRGHSQAELFGVGSLINTVPSGFDGWIWGSGSFGYEEPRLSHAKIAALRGPLTAERMGLELEPAFGDPGLLMPRVVRAKRKRWTLGIVPHVSHQNHDIISALRRRLPREVLFIDVRQRPETVAKQISRCQHIVSTSLHGVIVADAYRVPAAWATLSELEGGDFKFRDHDAAMDVSERRIVLEAESLLDDLVRQTKAPETDLLGHRIQQLEQATHAMRESMLQEASYRPHALWRRQLRG